VRLVRLSAWRPARREFLVRSDQGGRFVLVEQFFPGWEGQVDGHAANIERWNGAFQAVYVPPGEHTVEFRYHSRLLPAGAAISLLSLVLLVFFAKWHAKRAVPRLY
jgi:uncharacterized membrane protein YfhO